MSVVHYHVVIDYDGHTETSEHSSFESALRRARRELAVEKLFDGEKVRRLRRKFTRRNFIPRVYAEWVGSSVETDADRDIRIEVSACTPGMHA